MVVAGSIKPVAWADAFAAGQAAEAAPPKPFEGSSAYMKYDPERAIFEFKAHETAPQTMTTAEFETYVQSFLRDVTVIGGDGQHGTQVEYTDAQGQAFLWYPGNKKVLVGHWRTKLDEQVVDGKTLRSLSVCFAYPKSSRNPVTGASGGKEECASAAMLVMGSYFMRTDRRPGDAFKLSSGAIPYVLGRDDRPIWPVEAL
ncbi:hypothetical protein [Caulobacter sp. DWR2-3-1b2]|uniref:hypothetical protein n=1 Tax=unclassified Caulobacter TaxID=2648921 RepID=UPI003CF335D2